MNRWKPFASVTLAAALVIAPMASMGAYADDAVPPDQTVQVADQAAAPADESAATADDATAPDETAPADEATAPAEPSAPAAEEVAVPVEEPAAQIEESAAVAPDAATAPVATARATSGSAAQNDTPDEEPTTYEAKWVFVCKYVGTPHVDERLQSGNNPIAVSVNSIENNRWNGVVPGWFSDAHDRSYVIAYDESRGGGQAGEPTAQCPAPQSGPATATVQVTAPTCVDRDGSVLLTYSNATVFSATRNGLTVGVGGFTSGTMSAPTAGTYVLVLHAQTGYTFEGGATTKILTFTVPAALTAQDCAATGTVQVTAPTCVDLDGSVLLTYSHATVFSATRNGAAVAVGGFTSGTNSAPLAGSYVLVLHAETGYTFEGGATTKTLTFTVPAALTAQDCPAAGTVQVTAPTCADLDGSVLLTYSHATVFSATRNGTTVAVAGFPSGTMSAPTAGTYVLVLHAQTGYTFEGGATTKTLTFTVPDALTAQDCAATATVQVMAPTCVDLDGSVMLAYLHATVTSAIRDGAAVAVAGFPSATMAAPMEGDYTLVLTAQTGYTFEGGAITKTLTFTVPDALTAQDCAAPIPALFDANPAPPTCESAGALPSLSGTFPNVTFSLDGPTGGGPGEYTLTVTPNEGYVLTPRAGWTMHEDGSASRTFTVQAALGFQSTDPTAPCYLTTGNPPPPPVPGTPPAPGTVSVPGTTTVPGTTSLPATGVSDMMPWGIGAAMMLLAGAALVATRHLARR